MPFPTDQQEDVWRGLFRAYARGRGRVDAALKAAGLPPLEVYDVLLELDRHTDLHGLTAKVLETRLLLPQYGVSRLLKRLEQDGLIQRMPNPDDNRSTLLKITIKGREMRQAMWNVYGPAISTFFSDAIDQVGIAQLNAALQRLAGYDEV